jgi:hypothetical protein
MQNVGASNFIKQTLLHIKGHKSIDGVIMGNFNTSLSSIDRSFRQSTMTPQSYTVP